MKIVTVTYTDNTSGDFYCKDVSYDRHLTFLRTTDGETIVIPHRNVYMIKEREVEVTE